MNIMWALAVVEHGLLTVTVHHITIEGLIHKMVKHSSSGYKDTC
jgi:hypothetical protein